jgi:hypothetical protein
MKNSDKILLTPKQAESVLLKGKQIHTFRSGTGMLIGCDWSRKSIIEALKNNPDRIEIGGDQCKRMGHGLVVWTSETDPLFIECDKDKLQKLEDELTVKL